MVSMHVRCWEGFDASRFFSRTSGDLFVPYITIISPKIFTVRYTFLSILKRGIVFPVCLVSSLFSRVWINRSAEQGKLTFPCEIWSSRDGFGRPVRVSLLILHTQAESDASSRDSSRFPRRRPQIPPTAMRSVPSLSGHAIAYRWRSLPRVRRQWASSPQASSSNGCCLCRSPWTN